MMSMIVVKVVDQLCLPEMQRSLPHLSDLTFIVSRLLKCSCLTEDMNRDPIFYQKWQVMCQKYGNSGSSLKILLMISLHSFTVF